VDNLLLLFNLYSLKIGNGVALGEKLSFWVTSVWFWQILIAWPLFKTNLTVDQANMYAYMNAMDIVVCGFGPKKTCIFSDFGFFDVFIF
jgi:hypothetical protein